MLPQNGRITDIELVTKRNSKRSVCVSHQKKLTAQNTNIATVLKKHDGNCQPHMPTAIALRLVYTPMAFVMTPWKKTGQIAGKTFI